jgi:hypothetical protein
LRAAATADYPHGPVASVASLTHPSISVRAVIERRGPDAMLLLGFTNSGKTEIPIVVDTEVTVIRDDLGRLYRAVSLDAGSLSKAVLRPSHLVSFTFRLVPSPVDIGRVTLELVATTTRGKPLRFAPLDVTIR